MELLNNLETVLYSATKEGMIVQIEGAVSACPGLKNGANIFSAAGIDASAIDIEEGQGRHLFHSIVKDSHTTHMFTLIKKCHGGICGLTAVIPQPQAGTILQESRLDYLKALTRDMLEKTDEVRKKISEEQSKIKELEELKKELVSTVSHELRTPLSIISEGVSIVIEGVVGPLNERQTHFLHTVKNNVERLSALINDILDIEKLEAGKAEFIIEKLSIPSVLEECFTSFCEQMSKKGLRFSKEAEPGLRFVMADRQKIMQVLYNLISNAMKFTPEGGAVTLSAGAHGGRSILFCVKDTGSGISPEYHEAVFEKFRQIARKTGPGQKGTGLGLAISRKLVEKMGGSIWVESELEKGSRFYFTLPAGEE